MPVCMCECMPASIAQRGLARNRWWKRLLEGVVSPFTWLLAARGSSSQATLLGNLQGYGSSLISTARLTALHLGAPSNSMLVPPGDFMQLGPTRVHLWLHSAGGWTCSGPSGLRVSSDRSSLPATSTSRGRAEGTWETGREKQGIREEMLPAARPRAGRCSRTENHPKEMIAVTMTMSAAWH